jgi:HPt (histidine-containing phosphotransfer) domain-containing protein
LPDLDYDTALANMAGMAELYQEALQTFWLEAPLLQQQYCHYASAANWAEARRAAHSLKSSAAVMGGLALSEAAKALEQLAAAGEQATPERLAAASQVCQLAWLAFQQQSRPYLPA